MLLKNLHPELIQLAGVSYITAITVWNRLPEDIVGLIGDRGAQSFKSRVHKHLLQMDLHR